MSTTYRGPRPTPLLGVPAPEVGESMLWRGHPVVVREVADTTPGLRARRIGWIVTDDQDRRFYALATRAAGVVLRLPVGR